METGTLGLVIYISRLAGVAPYLRRANNGVSKPIFVLGLIGVTSICLYIVLDLWLKMSHGDYDKTKNLVMLDMIRVFGNFLLIIVVMIGACTSAKRIAHMVWNLKKLDKIHESICSFKWSVLGETTTNYLVWIYMSGILTMRVMDCFLQKSLNSSPIFGILMTIVRVLVELCLLQIVLFSKRILATLKFINLTLHQLSYGLNQEEQSKYVNKKKFKPRLAFVHSRDDPLYFEGLYNTGVNESIEYTIRGLSKNYMIICEIVRDTTAVNGLLLIVALLNQMLHFEITSYHIVLWISYESHWGFETLFLICHVLDLLCGLFLMVDTFHHTHAEMERTELLVRCLLCQNEISLAINNELDLFQHILVLQKTTYSPFDLCTLDRSLAVKVLGMLVSYLVIIITYGTRLGSIANKDMLESLRLTWRSIDWK